MAGVATRAALAIFCIVGVGNAVSQLSEAAESASADALLVQGPAVALRSAAVAHERGDLERALTLLARVEASHDIVADHAALIHVRLLVEAGRFAEAERVARAAAPRYASSRLQPRIDHWRGDALRGQGDEEGARAAWRAALDGTRDGDLRATLYAQIAHSFERSGKRVAAAETWETLWVSLPVTALGREAGEHLQRMEDSLGELIRDAGDWRRHADKLFRRRRNPEALAAYDKAIAMGLSKSELRRAQKQRGHTLFRLRRYPEAVDAFSALPQEGDVPLWRARSMARADRVPESIAAFEKLAERARGDLGLRASFLAGLLLDGRNKHERAEAMFERVAQGGKGGVTLAALWRLGWSAYRADRHERAIRYFDRLIPLQDTIAALRTRYWRARSLVHMGDEEAAAAEFAVLARDYPLSYYGWRARARARDDGTEPTRARLEQGKNRLTAEQLMRPRILLAAGLVGEAKGELYAIARKARSLQDRLELAQLFSEAGEFHKAQRLIVDPYNETLARGPVARLEELWWHAWPSAFADYVAAATRAPGSVEPSLVFSIMREESGYRAGVMSPSGARGLLQIMDETGARLAARAGLEDFDAEQLFEPETNIDLGSNYLGELMRRFPGRLSASIASYNAGPRAVAGWIEAAPTQPDDEWVESIPYDQTRGYVKRVMRSIHAYEVLY